MPYTVFYHKDYPLTSKVTVDKCDRCKIKKLIQELPAEHNAGEIFVTSLCKDCLITLASEMI